MPALVFANGPLAGKSFELVPGTALTVGRDESNDIVIPEIKVSGEHLRITEEDGDWFINDLGSSNGTRVNGERTDRHALLAGDLITLGRIIEIAFSEGNGKTILDPKTEMPDDSETTDAGEASESELELVEEIGLAYNQLRDQLRHVIVGQEAVIEQVLIAVFARGHALLVGVPGLAKTLLVSTLSRVLDLKFKRIQFTPDLMPSDITGTELLEENIVSGKREFRFVHGPLFSNMVLADEINRTPPKTQAALLEAMQERHVTVGDKTYPLPGPFFVLATQNPIEQEGTYPLPEAQLDRFLFNIFVDYPDEAEEEKIIRMASAEEMPELEPVLDGEKIVALQKLVRRVLVADHIVTYASRLSRATRPKSTDAPEIVREMVSWGAGPRAGIALVTAAKARAVLHGRFHVTTADIQAVAHPVLRHRVLTTFTAEAAGIGSDEVITRLLQEVTP